MTPVLTRFAPSPTGHLHLGHVLHLWWVSEMAKHLDGDVIFRMEDHDQSRCRSEYVQSIIQDLKWLESLFHLAPDSQPSWTQSGRRDHYQSICERLMNADQVYACQCSRQDIQRASDQNGGELHYPGTCRDKRIPFQTPNTTLRLTLPDRPFLATDFRHGKLEQNPARTGGDVIIRDRDGHWTYQFCVVIDDLEQRINLIIRGDDLLSSVGRQLAMRELLAPYLQLAHQPDDLFFLHHPLLLSEDGQKLSKRSFSESISSLRQQGWTALQLVAEVARQNHQWNSDNLFTEKDIETLIPLEVIDLARKAFHHE